MALNGISLVARALKSTATTFHAFLTNIRLLNPYGSIFLILDNAKIHHALMIQDYAPALDIHLIFLPPYSSDLNPIEYSFKDFKKKINRYLEFDVMIKNAELELTQLLSSRSGSYTVKWRQKFLTWNCN